jgi:hypothetical protein
MAYQDVQVEIRKIANNESKFYGDNGEKAIAAIVNHTDNGENSIATMVNYARSSGQ